MSGDRKDPFARAEEFLQLFSRGAEFTKELLVENERLRTSLARLEQAQDDASKTPEEWDKYREELQSQLQDLEAECASVRMRLQQVEEENQQFATRYLEIEEENNNLANLYVASYQLHSTLDLDEVLKIIVEIVINLVGAEVFAVYLLDGDSGQLDRDEYEHRFARMISELRDRKISGTRPEIMAALSPLKAEGKVDAIAWDRLTKSLGLA